MSIQLVGESLREYGAEAFDGSCTFTYKDAIDFPLEVSADESHLLMSAVVGELPVDAEAESLRRLLRWNHLGIETQGADLSLDETGVHIVLWISIPIETLDIGRFEQVMGSFLDLSEQLCASLVERTEYASCVSDFFIAEETTRQRIAAAGLMEGE